MKFTDHILTKAKYRTQRDNINPYTIEDEKVFDLKGKYLFEIKDFKKNEHLLYDRSTKCFISTGSMFCGALHLAGIISDDIDEVAYEIVLTQNLKKDETRFHWEAHKRIINLFLNKSDYDFDYESTAFTNVMKYFKEGFSIMCSINIKPWYPSGSGHLILAVGWREDPKGNILGIFVKDPFGKLLTNYKDHNGDNSYLPLDVFKKATKDRHIGFLIKRK